MSSSPSASSFSRSSPSSTESPVREVSTSGLRDDALDAERAGAYAEGIFDEVALGCRCSGDERCWDCADGGATPFDGMVRNHGTPDGDGDRHKRTVSVGITHRAGYLVAFAFGVAVSNNYLGAVVAWGVIVALVLRWVRSRGLLRGGRHGGIALGRRDPRPAQRRDPAHPLGPVT